MGPDLPRLPGGDLLPAEMSVARHGGRTHEVLRQRDDQQTGRGTRGEEG